MENKSLRFYAIMALWVLLFVLLFVSNRRVDLKTDINKSTSVSVSVEDTVSLSPSVITTHAYSAGDDTYQAFFKILQNASCYQKFNQNARSYSHDYEAHSITLRFADDASQNLLFTVYSDGVCQVNGKFVSLRSPMEMRRPSTSCCGTRWFNQTKNKRFEKFTSQGVYFCCSLQNRFFCSVLHVWSRFRICVSSQSARPVI